MNKNKQRFGEMNGKSVLTSKEVRVARNIYGLGVSAASIARAYGVGIRSMQRIVKFKSRKRG